MRRVLTLLVVLGCFGCALSDAPAPLPLAQPKPAVPLVASTVHSGSPSSAGVILPTQDASSPAPTNQVDFSFLNYFYQQKSSNVYEDDQLHEIENRLEKLEGKESFFSPDTVSVLIGALVGAVGAILGGIAGSWFLSRSEAKRHAKEEKEKTRTLLCGFYHEIDGFRALYDTTLGEKIASPTLTRLLESFPASGNYFPVYDGNIGDLGSMPQGLSKGDIMTCYTSSKALLDVLRINNALIEHLHQAEMQYRYSEDKLSAGKAVTECKKRLDEYLSQVRIADQKFTSASSKAKTALETYKSS